MAKKKKVDIEVPDGVVDVAEYEKFKALKETIEMSKWHETSEEGAGYKPLCIRG